MDLWRRIRRTHKSSNPTTAVVDDYPNLVKQFLTLLDKDFPWFKPLPNQFHRLTHCSYFMNNDRNALGVKSLEGLEKGNYTTKIFDSFYTYKGDREKANRRFKLLRIKSNRLLRNFKMKTKRMQRCSKCKQVGHNASNKRCPSNVDLSGMIEDGEAEEDMNTEETSADEYSDNEEETVNIDDLLYRDEELF